MQLTDMLARMGGFDAIARELGVAPDQAASGAAALLPALLGGLKKQAQAQPDGLDGLGRVLGQLGGGGLLDNVLAPEPTDVGRGNDVLGQIFGTKDVSRAVAQDAATRTGLDPALLKQMLPMLAMLVTGLMARHGGAAADAPTAPTAPAGPSGGGLGGLLGGLLGAAGAGGAPGGAASGLGGLLDMNGDGNALDDILRIAGRALR